MLDPKAKPGKQSGSKSRRGCKSTVYLCAGVQESAHQYTRPQPPVQFLRHAADDLPLRPLHGVELASSSRMPPHVQSPPTHEGSMPS